jgi:hypothetical protein
MNEQKRESKGMKSDNNRRAVEILIFLVASALGIYGLGQGLSGLFEAGQGIHLIWLAVSGVAFLVLFAQMGRVKDTWPRRHDMIAQQTVNEAVGEQLPAQAEEREVR